MREWCTLTVIEVSLC